MKRSTRQEKEEVAELSGAGGPGDDLELEAPSLSPEELDTVESWVTREDTDPIRPH